MESERTTETSALPAIVAQQAVRLREEQRAPAAQPSRLLQQPIFWHPRKATRYQTWSRSYRMLDNGVPITYIAETTNALPQPPRPKGKVQESVRTSPHGLLRYADLDVLMALSYHFTRYGQSLIEIDTRTVLTYMGYDGMDEAPYRELRASLQRMASTSISVSAQGAGLPSYCPSRLINLHGAQGLGGGLSRGMIRVGLSEEWRQGLGKGYTLVDMHAYAHLCRIDRTDGLPRVLFLFFNSVKNFETGRVNIPVSWVAERWRDTKGSKDATCFENPLDPRSALYAACRSLHESGVMELGTTYEDANGRTTKEQRICGVFAPASAIPKIPDHGPRQISLFVAHRVTGDVQPAPPPAETPSAEVSDDEIHSSDMGPAERLRSEETLFFDETIIALTRHMRVNPRAIIAAKHTDFWTSATIGRMLTVVAYLSQRGDITTPGPYVAKVLKESCGTDPRWKELISEAQVWALSSAGPLQHLRHRERTLRELKEAIKNAQPGAATVPTVTSFSPPPPETASAPPAPTSTADDSIGALLDRLGVQRTIERMTMLVVLVGDERRERAAQALQATWLAEDRDAGSSDEDDAAIEALAQEISAHRDIALRLRIPVAPIHARFAAAAQLLGDAAALAAWRTAVAAT